MNGIVKLGENIVLLAFLNVLWVAFTIGTLGIGFGASNTAMFKVCDDWMNPKKGLQLWDCYPEFYKAFKENFKQSTYVWLITVVLSSLILFNIKYALIQGDAGILVILQSIILIQLIIVNIYAYYFIAKFSAPLKRMIISALMIGNAHLFTSITAIIIFIALFITIGYTRYLTGFIFISGYILVLTYVLKPILKKYSEEE